MYILYDRTFYYIISFFIGSALYILSFVKSCD